MNNSKSNSNTKRKTGRRAKDTPDWAPAFIGALMEGASITTASSIAGVHITMPYKRRVEDEEFKKAWREACEIGTEFLEQEAARRAFHGTLKPVFHKGIECGQIREYSDTLIIFLLKARKPEKYREGIEESGRGSFVLNVNIVQADPKCIEREVIESPLINIEVLDVNSNQQDNSGLLEATSVPQ